MTAFIRNCWYVAAWEHELPADGMLARTVLGEPLLLFRTSGGGVACLEDRCCHRHAPLSMGRREGDCVRCGYHGLKFDAQGACIDAPGIERIPPKARVRTYPVVTRRRWVFVWMGDPQQANPALLPDNFSCEHPEWHYKPGYLHYTTPYLLICDNLLDFSHLSYVHEKTLGGSPRIAQARAEVGKIDRGVRVTRLVHDVPPSRHAQSYHRFDGNVDRRFVYDFVLPGILLMESGARPARAPSDPDWSGGTRLHSCQALTPESATSTHYFFQQSYHGAQRDEQVVETMYQGLLRAFEEDRAMITAQYERIRTDADRAMLPLAMDRALLEFRRLVASMIQKESPLTGGIPSSQETA